jgi:lysyl-tRNA synthetase class 2
MSDLADFYHRVIVEPGKQPLFLLLVAFVVTFLFIRLSVRMIRAEVSWWPGNVSAGDTHIHHMVFGVVLLFLAGVGAFTPAGSSSPWLDILAALFGVGGALVFDEFALILHLRDVYWAEQGRTSVDAVILGTALTGMLVLGALPLGVDGLHGSDTSALWNYVVTLLINAVLVVIAFLKGKVRLGVLGVVFPLFALVGAWRLGRPGSPWARWRYRPGSRKCDRAGERARRHDARWIRWKNSFTDAVAGRPDPGAR